MSLLFTNFSKTLSTTERRLTTRLTIDLSNILKMQGPQMKPSTILENKIPSDTYSRVLLVCMKVQAHCHLEPPWDTVRTRCLWRIKLGYDLFNQLGSYRNIMQIQISSRWDNRQRNTWVIKIRVLKVLSKQFCYIRCRRLHLRAIE